MRLGSYYTEGRPAPACRLGDGGPLVLRAGAGSTARAAVPTAGAGVPTAGAGVPTAAAAVR